MKRLVLLLIGLLLACYTQAQYVDVCNGQPSTSPSTFADFDPRGPDAVCVDATPYKFGWNLEGLTGWRYCREGARWRYQMAAVSHAFMAQTPQLAQDLWNAPKPLTDAAVNRIAKQYINTSMFSATLTKVWCPYINEIVAGIPPPSTGPVWRVTGSGTLYTVVNGKRGSIIPGRLAPVNALCNSSVPAILLYTASFFPLADGPLNEVTMCRQVAQ